MSNPKPATRKEIVEQASIRLCSISTTLNIYTHVLAEHLEQFERQRAKVLGIWGTYRAPGGGRVAEERQVAYYQ